MGSAGSATRIRAHPGRSHCSVFTSDANTTDKPKSRHGRARRENHKTALISEGRRRSAGQIDIGRCGLPQWRRQGNRNKAAGIGNNKGRWGQQRRTGNLIQGQTLLTNRFRQQGCAPAFGIGIVGGINNPFIFCGSTLACPQMRGHMGQADLLRTEQHQREDNMQERMLAFHGNINNHKN